MPGSSFEKPTPCLAGAGSQADGLRCGSTQHVNGRVPFPRKYSMVSWMNDSSPSLYTLEHNAPLNNGCGSSEYQRVKCLFSKCSAGLLLLRCRKKSHIFARMAVTSASSDTPAWM